jgi:hypothetical protein
MGVEAIKTWQRQRELAGSRAGADVRGRVRGEMLAHVVEHRVRLAVASVIGLALALGLALLGPNDIVRGAIFAGTATWWMCALWFLVAQSTGAASRLMGADGESWTASEVKPLRRHGWSVVNDLYLSGGNIDHVLVGPGGIVVLESKWSASPWSERYGQSVLADAAPSLSKQAWRLGRWENVRRHGTPEVRPVLVLWGAGALDVPHGYRLGSVEVVPGRRLRQWFEGVPETLVDEERRRAVYDAVVAHCAKRDDYVARHHPRPRSVERIWWAVVSRVGVFLAGFVGMAQLAAVAGSLASLGVLVVAVLLGAGCAWRIPASRQSLLLAGTGALSAVVLVAAYVLYAFASGALG